MTEETRAEALTALIKPVLPNHIWADATTETIDHDQLGRYGSDHPAERATIRIP